MQHTYSSKSYNSTAQKGAPKNVVFDLSLSELLLVRELELET